MSKFRIDRVLLLEKWEYSTLGPTRNTVLWDSSLNAFGLDFAKNMFNLQLINVVSFGIIMRFHFGSTIH